MSTASPPLPETQIDRPALLRAFAHVQQAGGAPGVDGERLSDFQAVAHDRCQDLARAVDEGTYRASPLRACRLPGHLAQRGRELLIPTVADRVLQRAVASAASEALDAHLHPSSHAYRTGRSAAGAAEIVRDALPERPWILDADIRDFYPSVEHTLLIEQLCAWGLDSRLIALCEQWIAAPALRGGHLVARDKGLPIGSPIAPLLANVFLHPLDLALGGPEWTYVRFSDDFVVCSATERDAHRAHRAAAEALSDLHLALHEAKTRVLNASEESFVFLGQLLRLGGPDPRRLRSLDRPHARTLYVAEPGAQLVRRGARILIRRAGADIVSVPLRQLRDIVVLGACDITSSAVVTCVEQGIPISLLSTHGRWCGRFESWQSPHPALRQQQMLAALDPPLALDMARAFVCAKLRNQRRLLQRSASRRPDAGCQASPHAAAIGEALSIAKDASRIDRLRGAEGQGARAFFSSLAEMIPPAWGFCGRARRPPTDPVNSLLSFGYTLLTSEAVSAVCQAGLDSYTGFLHAARQGRHSLALDLVEEFRPIIVDTLVLGILMRESITPDQFSHDPATGAVLLTDAARPVFLREYERRLLTLFRYERTGERISYRRALSLQAQHLALCIREPARTYLPVLLT